jgi:hypothetical protein
MQKINANVTKRGIYGFKYAEDCCGTAPSGSFPFDRLRVRMTARARSTAKQRQNLFAAL